jgi:hypothetical protein
MDPICPAIRGLVESMGPLASAGWGAAGRKASLISDSKASELTGSKGGNSSTSTGCKSTSFGFSQKSVLGYRS